MAESRLGKRMCGGEQSQTGPVTRKTTASNKAGLAAKPSDVAARSGEDFFLDALS